MTKLGTRTGGERSNSNSARIYASVGFSLESIKTEDKLLQDSIVDETSSIVIRCQVAGFSLSWRTWMMKLQVLSERISSEQQQRKSTPVAGFLHQS